MKISDQFILRTIADENILIPTGDAAVYMKGLIALSESAVLIYEKLKDGCTREDIINALTSEYEVSYDVAASDTDEFLAKLKSLNMLTEE